MTASPEALAPAHRPSPRAVVLAILGVALLGLLAVGGMQYAMPQGNEARGVFVVSVPTQPGARLIRIGPNTRVWLTRTVEGTISAIAERDLAGRTIQFVPARELPTWVRECSPAGVLAGYDDNHLDGAPMEGPGRLFRYPSEVDGAFVRIDLGHRSLVRRSDTSSRCEP
ncbi:MAG: hypothetical protein WCI61_04060 [Chloroflexota bacterium]